MMTGSIAIAGLGLIGGSLARDLAARGISVLGYDPAPTTMQKALEEGVIGAALGPDLAGVESAEALVIAAPPANSLQLLESAAHRIQRLRLVTDVGSTKLGITAAARRLGLAVSFVGGHPLAGGHRAGWNASQTKLFEGARVFLTPTAESGAEALTTARALWAMVGARTEEVDAGAHDREMAWLSHLPQAASTGLALALAGEGLERSGLGPGGRELTRLAGSQPALWTEIMLGNAEEIVPALRSLEANLRHLRQSLEAGAGEAIHDFFAAGQRWAREE